MCGIAGIVDRRGRPVDRDTLHAMTRILRHRGPDGTDTHVGGAFGFGHQRLAIIDPTDTGRQPMTNEDGSLWIVLNGEIYNYRALRAELAERHRFASASDTEVILHLYEEEGVACVRRLRGMFAFALWDERRRRLVLARDRIGQKPLVYTMVDDRLYFASEVKALLQVPELEARIHPESVDHFFAYGFVPWPATMFENIAKLPPATLLVMENGAVRQERYWWPALDAKVQCSEDEARDGLREVLRDTMRAQMVSDVPVGLFLSGGLDSSVVAALMAETAPRPLHSFSLGFEGRLGTDADIEHARIVADALGTEHHEVVVGPSIIDELPSVMWHFDEPYINRMALAHRRLCAEAKTTVKVVHAGDGADELFGGYPGYSNWKLVALSHRPLEHLGWARGLLRRVAEAGAGARDGFGWRDMLRVVAERPEDQRATKKDLEGAPARALYADDFRASLPAAGAGRLLREFYRELGPGDFLDKQLFTDLLLHDSHGVTTFSDVLGMAHGLEIRSIFLDHVLVEYVASLSPSLKVKGFDQRKFILRRAVEHLLPRAVLQRRKMSYGDGGIQFPALFDGAWNGVIRDVVLGSTLEKCGFFQRDRIERLWRAQQDGHGDQRELLWALTCFGTWYDVCAGPRVAVPA